MADLPKPARDRRLIVAILLSLATVVAVAAMMALWINRQALNTDAWTDTSGKLLKDKTIQPVLSEYMVNELFTKVDVQGEVREALPPAAAGLAGPVSGGLRQVADQLAPRLLASPRLQAAWRQANHSAHAQFLRVVDGGSDAVSTTNGEVVLNMRPLVDQLAAALGVSTQVAAARTQLQGAAGSGAAGGGQKRVGITLPASTGKLVIMRSENLKTAQNIASAIKGLAIVLTGLMIILFGVALRLASGWRRVVLRRIGWCLITVGLTVLVIRRYTGGQIVESLVKSDSVKPAAHSTWAIATTLLYDICIATFAYGVACVAAAWLAGATKPAMAVRRELAPVFRFHLVGVCAAVAMAYLLLLAWGPTPALRKPWGIVLFAALIVVGVVMLRRQLAAEYPDAQARADREPTPPTEPIPEPSGQRFADLEALAALHDRGVLNDAEFDSQKVLLLNGS